MPSAAVTYPAASGIPSRGTAGLGIINDHVPSTPHSPASDSTDTGFVWGLGVEGKINPTMSARLEYLSYNNDSSHAHADTVDVIRAGLNIKLGPCFLGTLC